MPDPLASSAAALEAALPLWWIANSSTLRFLVKRGKLNVTCHYQSTSLLC